MPAGAGRAGLRTVLITLTYGKQSFLRQNMKQTAESGHLKYFSDIGAHASEDECSIVFLCTLQQGDKNA